VVPPPEVAQEGQARAPKFVLPPDEQNKNDDVEQLRQEMAYLFQEFSNTVRKLQKEHPEALIAFQNKIFEPGTTIAMVLEANQIPAQFDPPELANIQLREQTFFSNLWDFATYIGKQYGLFVTVENGVVKISRFKKAFYNIEHLEGLISAGSVRDLLHSDQAYAKVYREIGKLEVYDDYVGHENVKRYIDDLRAKVFQSYQYLVEVFRNGELVEQYRGRAIATYPVALENAGRLLIVPGKEKIRVALYLGSFGFTTPFNFYLPARGGTWKAQENEWFVRVKITPIMGKVGCKIVYDEVDE